MLFRGQHVPLYLLSAFVMPSGELHCRSLTLNNACPWPAVTGPFFFSVTSPKCTPSVFFTCPRDPLFLPLITGGAFLSLAFG